MNKTALRLLLLAGALFTAQAQAQYLPAGKAGPYAGVGLLHVTTDNAREFAATFATSGDGSATGFKAYGGYLWPNRFGVEVGYYDLGTYDVRTGTAKTDDFQTSALTVSGVFATPFASNFDFTAKLGLAFTNVDYSCFGGCGGIFVNTSKSGIAGIGGVGIGWRITPSFSLRADADWFGGVTHSVGGLEADYGYGALSIGGQLKF
jgi:hypothetical protein